MSIVIGEKEFFNGIGKISFEGEKFNNPLAIRWH